MVSVAKSQIFNLQNLNSAKIVVYGTISLPSALWDTEQDFSSKLLIPALNMKCNHSTAGLPIR